MPTVEIAIKVNGNQKAIQAIPIRKAILVTKWLERQGQLPAGGGTVVQQAEAILARLIRCARFEARQAVGDEYYDEMLTALHESDPTWTDERVQDEGVDAAEAAYDAL